MAVMSSSDRNAPGKGYYQNSLMKDWDVPPPWFVYRIALAMLTFLHYILDVLTPPAVRTLTKASDFMPSAWLGMTAHLGIPDLLKDGPKSAAEIAQELGGLREDDLYRALRMLVKHGFYTALPVRRGQPVLFKNNAATTILRSDHPHSIRYMTMSWHGDVFTSFSREAMLWHLKQKGGDEVPCAFEHVNGTDWWSYLKADPKLEEEFAKAMKAADCMGLSALMGDFQWGSYKRVVDIGGATGSVVAAVATTHPHITGVLFDQPQVVEAAAKDWKEDPNLARLQGRVKLIGGDFFKPETIPSGQDGDVYFLRNIIHDWSDESSIKILRSVRKAMGGADSTLTLVEVSLIPEFGGPSLLSTRVVIDMLMHAVVRGKERTETQWKSLFEASGFKLVKCHETRGPFVMIEAKPV